MYAVFKVQFISGLTLNLTANDKPVGLSGLEPPTSRLSGVRSNQLSYKPILKSSDFSGDEEIRTLDPLLARQVLSQLSYIPKRILAATCSPTPSPVQYHRPLKS